MIALDRTTESLTVSLAGAVATTEPDCVATYYEHPNTDATKVDGIPGSTQIATNGATRVTVVEAPSSTMRRNLKTLLVHNRDTAAVVVIVEKLVSSTYYRICRISVPANDTLVIDDTIHLASGSIAHNLLSATHTDTTAATVVRGDIITGQGASPLWTRLALGTAGKILRSDGTDLVYSTATFADTYAVSTLLYAASSNTVSGLATANGAALITSAAGVPTWTTLTDGRLIIGWTGNQPVAANLTGTSNQLTVTNGGGTITLSTPQNTHTAATPTFASMTLTGASSLTLGTASSLAGSIILKNATNAFTITLAPAVATASFTATFPDASGARTVPYLERANTWTALQTMLVSGGAHFVFNNASTGRNETHYQYNGVLQYQVGTDFSAASVRNFYFYDAVGGTAFVISANGNLLLSKAGITEAGASAVGNIGLASGTAPTTSPADYAAIWVADSAALNANWWTRNENGVSKQITGLDKRRSATQTVTDTVTLAADDTLVVQVVAAGQYYFELTYIFTTVNTSGVSVDLGGGTCTFTSFSAAAEFKSLSLNTFLTAIEMTAATTLVGFTATGTVASVQIRGTFVANGAGTFAPRFAQNAETGAAESVIAKANSTLILTHIGA